MLVRLMKTPLAKTDKKNWKDVISHRDDVLLEGFEIFNKNLVVEERKNGLIQLLLRNLFFSALIIRKSEGFFCGVIETGILH